MRDKEIVGLYQAYLDVYSNLNEEVEQLDELSSEKMVSTRHRRMQNLDAAQRREMDARGGATMGEISKRAEETSKAAEKFSKHNQLSSRHARSRARMNKEEVENWVNSLIEEGYDLSEYTWDDMYEMYVTEADSIAAMRERAAKRRKQRYGDSDTSRGGRDDFAPITDYEAANKKWARPTQKEEVDLFDAILEHLVAEGYADTNESALAIMANMSDEWRQSIVEGGFNSSGRYDVGGGRTVGPVAGAVRSLFSGNLPKGQTYVPPSPQRGTNRPPAVPSSKGDSGKLTDFGAGGGKAKLKTGMSVGQVERQGRMNKGDYSG